MSRNGEAMMSVLLGGQPRAGSAHPGFSVVEGRVHAVTAAGVIFTVPDFDGGKHRFGPAPWPRSLVDVAAAHDHEGTAPTINARCLVIFVGTGVDTPWVVGWWDAS